MQTAMAVAMGQAVFPGGDVEDTNIDSFFFVPGSGAAASFGLVKSRDILMAYGYIYLYLSPKSTERPKAQFADIMVISKAVQIVLDAGRYAFKPLPAPYTCVQVTDRTMLLRIPH